MTVLRSWNMGKIGDKVCSWGIPLGISLMAARFGGDSPGDFPWDFSWDSPLRFPIAALVL